MPLSVPLKTSRTGSRGIPYTSAQAATQAAVQLAAQTGATAVKPKAATAAPSPRSEPAAPAAPIPPVTGAVWGHGVSASSIKALQAAAFKPPGLANNTPQAVLRSFHEHERERELKHWDSKGKQVTSVRPTCPAVSFHNGPSGRVVEEKARCREIGEHPCIQNPGPERYDVQKDATAFMCTFQTEPRFKNGLFGGQTESAHSKLLKFSTECHPLSPTYPYQEAQPIKSENDASTLASHSQSQYMHPRELHDESDRRNAIRGVDLNSQYFKFKHKPTWGFGSSGLGFRFMPGTQFSRKPDQRNQPHSRLRTFRDLREAIDEKPEEEYRVALDKALSEAATAASAASGPQPQAPTRAAPEPPVVEQAERKASRKSAAAPEKQIESTTNGEAVATVEPEAPRRNSGDVAAPAPEPDPPSQITTPP